MLSNIILTSRVSALAKRVVLGPQGSLRRRAVDETKHWAIGEALSAVSAVRRASLGVQNVCTKIVLRLGPEQIFEVAAKRPIPLAPQMELGPVDEKTLLDILARNPNTIVFKTNLAGKIIYISPSVKEVLGFESEDVIRMGINFFDGITRADLREIAEREFREGIKKGESWGGHTFFYGSNFKTWHYLRTYFRMACDLEGKPTGVIGIAIDLTQMKNAERRMEKQVKVLIAFGDIIKMISKGRDIDLVLTEIVKQIPEILPKKVHGCGIKILTPEGIFLPEAKIGLGKYWGELMGKELNKTLSWRALNLGVIIGTSDIKQWKSTAGEEFKSGIYVPLIAKLESGEVKIGVINFYSREENAFTDEIEHVFTKEEIESNEELSLIHSFAEIASSVIDIAGMANQDWMTRVPNLRVFEEKCKSEIRKSIRNKKPLSILICDIKYFKTINDIFGHTPNGDNVIKSVAKILKQISRETDVIARYGGDEFALLLPETDSNGVKTIAQRIIKVAELEFAIGESGVDTGALKKAAEEGLLRYKGKNEKGEYLIGIKMSIGAITLPQNLFEKKGVRITQSIVETLYKTTMSLVSNAYLAAKHEENGIVLSQNIEILFNALGKALE